MSVAAVIIAALPCAGCRHRLAPGEGSSELALQSLASGSLCADGRAIVRAWCDSARRWPTAASAPIPSSLVGLRAELRSTDDPLDAISHHVTLVAVVGSRTGGVEGAAMGPLRPETALEREQLARVAAEVEEALTHRGQVAVPAELAALLAAERERVVPAVRDARGWRWTAPSMVSLRQTGGCWMAVEEAPTGQTYVSILTDRLVIPTPGGRP